MERASQKKVHKRGECGGGMDGKIPALRTSHRVHLARVRKVSSTFPWYSYFTSEEKDGKREEWAL